MKYILKKVGHGKFSYYRVISVSDKKARKLESEGRRVFDNRSTALNEAKNYR